MKVYVLMNHVPYEFGCVLGVYDSEKKAEAELNRLAKSRKGDEKYIIRDELAVEEYDVE